MWRVSLCVPVSIATAMDNASKNSKDMVDSLKLTYTGRIWRLPTQLSFLFYVSLALQYFAAKITSELAEIVSGAESLVQVTASD